MSIEFNYPSSAVDLGLSKTIIIVTHANQDTNTVGANHACKRVLIKAHPANTGVVWIDFDNVAVQGDCFPLSASETVSLPMTNTNLINCNYAVGGEKVSVVYTN